MKRNWQAENEARRESMALASVWIARRTVRIVNGIAPHSQAARDARADYRRIRAEYRALTGL